MLPNILVRPQPSYMFVKSRLADMCSYKTVICLSVWDRCIYTLQFFYCIWFTITCVLEAMTISITLASSFFVAIIQNQCIEKKTSVYVQLICCMRNHVGHPVLTHSIQLVAIRWASTVPVPQWMNSEGKRLGEDPRCCEWMGSRSATPSWPESLSG